jgi:asparagine synthase (glutamine-hydrolysing)
MISDLKNYWSNNFDRDIKVCRYFGLKLLLLFTHPEVIKYGLSLPLEYLLPNSKDQIRKLILRKLARTLGFPEKISNRPKIAVQYSSGVHKAIYKIAKENGTNPWDYLNLIHTKVKEHYFGKD